MVFHSPGDTDPKVDETAIEVLKQLLIRNITPENKGISFLQFVDCVKNGFRKGWAVKNDKDVMEEVEKPAAVADNAAALIKLNQEALEGKGDVLNTGASLDVILQQSPMIGMLLKKQFHSEADNVPDMLANADLDNDRILTMREFIKVCIPSWDFTSGLAPKQQILKSKLTEIFVTAQKASNVNQGRRSKRGSLVDLMSGTRSSGANPATQKMDSHTQHTYNAAMKILSMVGPSAQDLLKQKEQDEADAAAKAIADAETEAAKLPPPITYNYLINGEPYGSFNSLDEMIARLKAPLQGWPVLLTKPVINPLRQQRRVQGSGSGEKDANAPSYVWENLSIEDAEKMLVGPDGTFVLKVKAGTNRDPRKKDFVLTVKFQGSPTHHSITRNKNDEYLVNKQLYGHHTTLDALIEHLGVKNDTWPIVLNNPLRPAKQPAPMPHMPPLKEVTAAAAAVQKARTATTATQEVLALADRRVESIANPKNEKLLDDEEWDVGDILWELDCEVAREAKQKRVAAAETIQESARQLRIRILSGAHIPGLCVEANPTIPTYLWDAISKDETEQKLIGEPDGTFLVRRRLKGTQNQFNLAIMYDGLPTHHAIDADSSGHYIVNKQNVGVQTKVLHELIEHLTSTVSGWPVMLTNPVYNPANKRGEPMALVKMEKLADTAEVEVAKAGRVLWILERKTAHTEEQAELFISTGYMDCVDTVKGVMKADIKKLMVSLRDDYVNIVGERFPVLPESNDSILMPIILAKLEQTSNAIKSKKGLGRMITTKSTGKLVPIKNVDAHATLFARVKAGQVMVMQELLAASESKLDSAQQSELDIKRCDIFEKELNDSVATAERAYQKVKLNMEDLQARIRKGQKTPQGQIGAVPPMELKRLVAYKGTAELKLQASAEEYEMTHASVAMLMSLREKPQLRHFYLRMQEHMTSVVQQLQTIHYARQTTPDSLGFIQCALGYVPVPTYGSDAGAAKLFKPGVLETPNDVTLVVAEACRAIAYRFQEQAQIVQFEEVERFAHWFARPILQILVSSVVDTRVVTFVEKQSGEKSFGLAIVTDLRQETKHTISQVIQGGPAYRAGVQAGDFVVKIDGKRVDQLKHDELLALLAQLPHAKIELGRGKDWEPPTSTKAVAGYFIRAVDRYRGDDPLEEFDDDPLPRLFNEAMSTGLLGGLLMPTIKGKFVDPSEFVVRPGLKAISEEDEVLYFQSAVTEIKEYGHRQQLPACMGVYDSVTEELKVLRWSETAEFFAHNPAAPKSQDANDANTNKGPGDAQSESIYRQKELEAEQLNQRVLDLEKQLRDLKRETSA